MNWHNFITVFLGMLVFASIFYEELQDALPGWFNKILTGAFVLFSATVAYYLQDK